MTRHSLQLAAVILLLLALIPGCRSREEQARRQRERDERRMAKAAQKREEPFPIFDRRPDVGRMMNAQAIVGARKDATLHADHFDGTQLNSLGRQKLSLMLHREPADRPQPIYIDLPEADTLSGERRKTLAQIGRTCRNLAGGPWFLRDGGAQRRPAAFAAAGSSW